MPIKPRKGESKDNFVARCMHELSSAGATPRPQDQKVAICLGAWRDAHGGAKPKQTDDIEVEDGENYQDFMDRCTTAGNDEGDCQDIWDEDQEELAMDGGNDGLEIRPHEIYAEFMNRCLMGGNTREDCQAAWDEDNPEAKSGRSVHKTHESVGSDFDFVLSDEKPDRTGDVVTAAGWDTKNFKRNPVALFNHDKNSPIGRWAGVKVESGELRGRLEFASKGTSPRIDEIRALVEQGILRATSVGFRPLESEPIEEKDKKGKAPDPFRMIFGGPTRYLKQELLEVSLVAVPANANALRVMKSLGISEATQKIVFKSDPGSRKQPSAAGAKVVVKMKEANMPAKKPIAEQIAGYEATRAAKTAQMNEIMETSADKGETLDAEQQEAWDTISNEVTAIDKHLERMRILEKTNLTRAVEIKAIDPTDGGGSQARVVRVTTQSNVPKGILFARHCIAKTYAALNHVTPMDAARKFGYFNETPELEEILKAPISVGTAVDPAWAGPLVQPTVMASEFIALLVPMTIIGRIPGLRRVPFNIKIPREITAASVSWVGEGKPKPVSAMAFDLLTLGWTKVAGIVPVTEELFRFSNPAIEALVRDSLLQAVALLTDHDFLDPSKAAVVGVSPASVTNAVTPITPSGTTGDALRADLGSLISKFAAANMNLAGLVLVMTSQQAVRISLMRTALGTVEFPGLGPTGGTLEGIPVITSENIVHTGASPSTGSLIVALNAPEILLADDGAVAVDMSREASLQMDSAPDDPTTASTVMISLWQRNMVALRAERMINWLKRRSGAVQYINGAAYA